MTHEYVAICADMEGASTSKERKKEVRQMEESYTQNVTVKALLKSATFKLTNDKIITRL